MYRSIEDLPPALRRDLPREAQELYRAAYNRVVEKATAAESRKEGNVSGDAHDAAMLAVSAEFSRGQDGRWRRDPIGTDVDDPGPEKGR